MTPDEPIAQSWEVGRVERLIDRHVDGLDPGRSARDPAYRRALALLGDEAAGENIPHVASVGFARDVLAELAVEVTADWPALRELACRLESDAGIPTLELGRELLRAPQLLRLAPEASIEVVLKLVLAFTLANWVTLWRVSSAGQPEQIARVGNRETADRPARHLAARLLAGQPVTDPQGADMAGIAIDGGQTRGALVSHGSDAASTHHLLMLEAAVPLLATMLERYEGPASSPGAGENRNQSADQMGPAERMLARVRYDLHDGPQQDLMLLAEDLRLFRSQLGSILPCDETRARVLGRFDDLEARLIAVDGDIRRISVSVESPFLHDESLADALTGVIHAFTQRTGIEPQLRLHGDFGDLTDSQHITLLSLIRETLGNIREHADAEHVTISLSAHASGVELSIIDDGRGFEPETMLVEAAHQGHLGLVGMHERVRMLGGETRIDSRPGGPTVISVSLPPAPASAPRRAR